MDCFFSKEIYCKSRTKKKANSHEGIKGWHEKVICENRGGAKY